MIPYGRQSISQDDIAAVEAVLRSDWLTQGPAVPRFEAAVGELCGAVEAVACNSATSALHLACLALGLGPGDRLWTSPNTFVASANCARYCGARVDFVDIDPHTYNLSINALEEKLRQAEAAGTLPKIVVPVDFAGQPCQLDKIRALADRYGFAIVEDASHAIGASYQSKPVGDGRYADITIFSFHPVKIITTGEGGMAVTNRPELAARMRRLRSHGITREESEMTSPSEGAWYYQQVELGFNYRLTDMQAALGLSQLGRLPQFLEVRRHLAASYTRALAGLPVVTPRQDPEGLSAWHLYCIRIDDARRRQVFDGLRAAGIGANVHYIPVHLQPDYRRLGFKFGDFPEAEKYYAETITLPLHPALSPAEQDHVITTLAGLLT